MKQNERQQQAKLILEDNIIWINLNQLDDNIKLNNSEVRYINDVSQLTSTGHDTRRFPCEVICGDNYSAHDLEADVLMTGLMNCTSNNTGIFIHPFYGEFKVIADGQIKRSTNLVNSIFVSTVSFTLVEVKELQKTPADLGEKIQALNAENIEMMNSFEVTEINKKSLLDKMSDMYASYNSAMNKINFAVQSSLGKIRDINSKIKKGYYDIVLAPANIINSSKEILNLGIQQTPKNLKDATKFYYDNAFSNPLGKRPPQSQNTARFDITEYDSLNNEDFSLYDPKTQDFNETLINMQNINTSISLMCETLNTTEVLDYTTITELKDLIFFAIDEASKQYEIMISTYNLNKPIIDIGKLRDLKSAVLSQYNALDLVKKEEHIVSNDMNIFQLLLEIYNDYNQDIYNNFMLNNPDLNSVILFRRGQVCLK